jgi:hypothetical protein
MDFTNNIDSNDKHNFFLYKSEHNTNFIFKNNKTYLYESFDINGNINYKMVLVNRNNEYYFFKLTNDDSIIRYNSKTNELHKMNLTDYYLNNFSQIILFDNKKIIIH